jgi:IS605 OrfB family transposase
MKNNLFVERTITVRLEPSEAIGQTVRIFNEATNFFLRLGFHNKTHSKRRLQALGYYEARDRWPALQSSLVQGARDCAADMLKRERCRRLPIKKPDSSARFNQRTFKAFLDSGSLSLTTVEGRLKVPLHIPEYFRKYAGGKIKALRVRDVDHNLMADLVVELPNVPIKDVANPRVVGIDRGVNNIAVTSDGRFFNSKHLRNVRGRYAYLRCELQSAGTRSAKRHLKRLSGRERRFQADVNHRIAKEIVGTDFDVLALEDLSIKKDKRLGKEFNRKLGRWAFVQFEAFLRYKSEECGKRVVSVPPYYTSQMCSRCGDLGIREGHSFRCPVCGFSLNADLNAARNIASLGKALVGRPTVNGPIVATGDAEHRTSVEVSYKPPISMGGS